MKTLKWLAALSAIMMSCGAFAALTAKVVVEDSGSTLRFVYDDADYGEKETDWFSVAEAETINPDNAEVPWIHLAGEVDKVVFDPTFAAYRPLQCGSWFYEFTQLATIRGIANLDTSRVTNMAWMFSNCQALQSLDLSHFSTAKVKDMKKMFSHATGLRKIYVSSAFTTAGVTSSAGMFDNCTELVGGKGTKYSSAKTDKTYARIDKAGQSGYFTDRLVEAPVGQYLSLDLVEDLGMSVDADFTAGDMVTVKVEGLAQGLKLVTTPVYVDPSATKKVIRGYVYTVTGVPTETVDVETQPMCARVSVTYKDKTKGVKGKGETLQPLPLRLVAGTARVLTAGVLEMVYGPLDIATLWPAVADAKVNPKDWSFKTWPAGLKYKDGVLSGTPTKAGEYPIVATHKRTLADGKTTVSEMYSAVLTVWGASAEKSVRYTDRAYVATKTKTLGPTVTGVSGQPTGIKWTKTLVKADAKKGTPEYPAYSLYGTPTKSGVYATTLMFSNKTKRTFLWKVTEGANGGFLDEMDWSVRNSALTVMQGVAENGWTCTLPADAKVTATGLPSGLALKQDSKTKAWSLSGTPTKAGAFSVSFKTVRNGVTVVERIAMTVSPNAYAGTYYGMQRGAYDKACLNAVVTVAEGGTVKLILTENTVKTTVTAKSLSQSKDGSVYAELTLPADKKKGIAARPCLIDLENRELRIDGGLAALLGRPTVMPGLTEDVVTTCLLQYCDEWDEKGSPTANCHFGIFMLTATVNAKNGMVAVSGKLCAGVLSQMKSYKFNPFKATTTIVDLSYLDPLYKIFAPPILVTDAEKNTHGLAVFNTDEGDGIWINGKRCIPVEDGLKGAFDASVWKNANIGDLTPKAENIILETGVGTVKVPLTDKLRATRLGSGGPIGLTLKDKDGWTWTCDILPVNVALDPDDVKIQFIGYTTGKKGKETTGGLVSIADGE